MVLAVVKGRGSEGHTVPTAQSRVCCTHPTPPGALHVGTHPTPPGAPHVGTHPTPPGALHVGTHTPSRPPGWACSYTLKLKLDTPISFDCGFTPLHASDYNESTAQEVDSLKFVCCWHPASPSSAHRACPPPPPPPPAGPVGCSPPPTGLGLWGDTGLWEAIHYHTLHVLVSDWTGHEYTDIMNMYMYR